MLIYLPGFWLLCIDNLRQKDPFIVKQWFNIAPRFILDNFDCDAVHLNDPLLDQSLQISSLTEDIKVVETARGWKGKSNDIYPGMLGWHSPKSDEIKPNRVLGFGADVKNNTWRFATLLSLNPFVPDHEFTRINASGRRGRFRWKMWGINYTVTYSRETSIGAEITVNANSEQSD
jgi:hypothetical protein